MTASPKLFRARTVITMDPDQPRASAILVDGDRIVAVGVFEDLERGGYEVDDTFADDRARRDQRLAAHRGVAAVLPRVVSEFGGRQRCAVNRRIPSGRIAGPELVSGQLNRLGVFDL